MAANDILKQVMHFFRLDAELENADYIHEEINKGIVFKGTNLWILIFAIIIASVGLNMNSTAVIIGAMLISPLMGPINGMGYSIATYDFVLFKKSVKNFSFAILASLIASTTYFFISPVSSETSELLARTSPTIYDVLIALFGGLAGIVAISSKNKGNVIPGVAIATALMPPLCTAGYGLATFQPQFFFGALYLFTINTLFIGLATLWTSQILKFPIRTIIDPKKSKKINQIISAVITIVIVPSLYFGYKLVQEEKFSLNATNFVKNIEDFEGNYLMKHNIDSKKKSISLEYAGSTMNPEEKARIKEKAFDFGLDSSAVIIEKGLAFEQLTEQSKEMISLRDQITALNRALEQKDAVISKKDVIIDSLQNVSILGKTLLSEIKTLYPEIKGCSFSETIFYHDSIRQTNKTALVIYKKDSSKISYNDRVKIEKWTSTRIGNKPVKIIFESK